jgi:hypothetical protein
MVVSLEPLMHHSTAQTHTRGQVKDTDNGVTASVSLDPTHQQLALMNDCARILEPAPPALFQEDMESMGILGTKILRYLFGTVRLRRHGRRPPNNDQHENAEE